MRQDLQNRKETEGKQPCADDIVCAALDVGEHILKNGGEIHTVEDTIERICYAFGATHVEVFTITTLIIASVRMGDGTYSQQMRRVLRTSNNLYVVEEMNRISRELCAGELPLPALRERIVAAKSLHPYPPLAIYAAAMLSAFGFSLFFGGNFLDGICAALSGVVITLINRRAPRSVNPMIVTVIGSACAGVLGIFLTNLGIGQHTDKIIIGTIMLIIPGLALGNSVRDMLVGDVISGAVRMIQSILLAVMIAFGFAVAMMLMGGVTAWPN